MNIIDISWPITEQITEYKNRKTVKLEKLKDVEHDNVYETMITLHSHTGTHIDSPSHFLKNGKTLDQLSLEKLCGPCKVLDLTHLENKITEQDLIKCDITAHDIILLKTKNSKLSPTAPFEKSFVYLEKSGAAYLTAKKIKCVGIDYLGIERNQPDHDTHKILLQNDIPIIEGLRLQDAEEKQYTLYCLPMPIQNIDACPARAILL